MGRRKKKAVAGAADTAACHVCCDATSSCSHRKEHGAAVHAAVDEWTRSQLSTHELGCGGEDVAACSMPAALAVKRRRSPDSRDMSPDSMHMPSPDASCAQLVQAEADLHCRQRYLMQHIMHIPPPKFVPKCDFTRILSDGAPRAAYRDLPHRMRTTNHWGQRKLFLSEVEFLSTFIHDLRLRIPPPERIVVVYAGAAPGNHIPYLFDLFDNKSGDLQFALFDPAHFNIDARRNQRFAFDEISLNPSESSCCNGFFTDDVARFYKSQSDDLGYVTLLISDIRSGDTLSMTQGEFEGAVQRDMQWQQVTCDV